MRRFLFFLLLLVGFCGTARADTASLTAQAASCPAGTNTTALISAIPVNTGGVAITLSGTWSGTVSFFGSADKAVTYQTISVTPSNSSTTVTTSTANGIWQLNAVGYTHICVLVTTFSSGTVVATVNPSQGSARTNSGGGGGGGVPSIAATGPITESGSPGATTIACATCVATGQTNVYGAFLQDFTSGTMEIPEGTGFTANVNSTIGLDTTANITHLWTNNADSLLCAATATDTTTTHALFATATAGICNSRAIATGDLPTGIPIANVGTSGLSGTAPVTISAAGAIGCSTCNTSNATVSTFSAGNLSPLFTTSVATATTTPALTFSLSNAAAGTVLGNATGSAAGPTYTTTPVLGVSGTAGTIGLFPASGNFTTTLGSAATASNTVNFFAAVPTNLHTFYCAVASNTCTLTDTGYAYNSIPNADLTNSATTVNGQTCTLGSTCTVNPPLDKSANGLANPTADATFTQPIGSTTGITLNGTAPASVSTSTGTNASSIFNLVAPIGGGDSNATGTAGIGGSPGLCTAGAGGAGTGTNAVGGAGGSCSIVTGAGGASNGTGINSNGGSLNITLGVAGTGGSGTAGKAGVVAVSGPTAGFHYFTQGSLPTTANSNIPANSVIHTVPASVTAYTVTEPGAAPTNNFSAQTTTTAGVQSFNKMPQTSMLTSQYTNSTTGFTNVTGTNSLAFSMDASTTYQGYCVLYYQAASTGGLNIEFTGPASPTFVTYGLVDPGSNTTLVTAAVATAYSTSLGAVVTTATTNFPATVTFGISNGVNAGTLQLLAKSSAAVQLQIQTGSYCVMQ